MTEQGKINREGAKPVGPKAKPAKAAKPNSLLERASGTFGLDALKPAKTPDDLPKAPKPVVAKKKEQPATATVTQAPVPPVDTPTADTAATRAEPVAQPQLKPAPQPMPLGGQWHAVDRDIMRDEGLIVPDDAVTSTLEEFRIVKRELLSDARLGGAKAQRILVCSPHPGEGKTYCSINLAIAFAAERDLEVLLVDADVLKPSVLSRLGMSAERGLMDALKDPELNPEDLAIETDIDGLFVLPSGTRTSRDAEYLASVRTGELIHRLTAGAPNRIVIFDTPPALAASAAPELAEHVGQALLIARADETSKAALEDASDLLSACEDIKLLLNGAQFSPSGRKFGDYGEVGD